MFTAMAKPKRSRGFTLLEITLAAAILGMMSLAIYRFVQSNITVLRYNAADTLEDARYSGLLELLTSQWQELPMGVGALSGEPFKFNDRPRDEITWVCGTGPGLLTRYAEGEFTVRMRLKPGRTIACNSAFCAGPGKAGRGRKRANVGAFAGRRERHADPLFRCAVERLGRALGRYLNPAAAHRSDYRTAGRRTGKEVIPLGRTPWQSLQHDQAI